MPAFLPVLVTALSLRRSPLGLFAIFDFYLFSHVDGYCEHLAMINSPGAREAISQSPNTPLGHHDLLRKTQNSPWNLELETQSHSVMY